MEREHQELLRRLALHDEALAATCVPCMGHQPRIDPRTLALVRLAALVSMQAGRPALAWAVEVAEAAGATGDDLVELLCALAPDVGLSRVGAAALELAELIDAEFDPPPGGGR